MVAHKPTTALRHHATRVTTAQQKMRNHLRYLARKAAEEQAQAAAEAQRS
jgi:hypothetical protein